MILFFILNIYDELQYSYHITKQESMLYVI